MTEADPDPQRTGRPWPRVSLLRRAGPVVLIVAALVAAGVSATVHENKGTTSAAPTSSGSGQQLAHSTVPLTYAAAAKIGKTGAYDWGAECDHHTGKLKIPTVYSPPCVPVPAAGATNGGATSSGVTADTVNLVYYQAQPGGLTSAISGAAGTPAQALATIQSYVAMFNHLYETYGRHVNLIVFNATGAATDPVAAHADAVTVAQQDHAFASIGGAGANIGLPGRVGPPARAVHGLRRLLDQRGDPEERALPVGQPAHGRHLALRDDRLRAGQVERQGRHLGRCALLPHEEAVLLRGQRDFGAARARLRRADDVADQQAEGGPRQHGRASRRSLTRSTSPRCPPRRRPSPRSSRRPAPPA